MKKLLLALAAIAVLPAAAQAQVRPVIEATGSNTSLSTDGVDYGVRLGLEGPIAKNLSVTADVGAENFLDGDERVLSTTAGLVAKVLGPIDAYGQAGVLFADGNTGYRLGTGLRLRFNENLYVRGGYQRDDYGNGATGESGVVGVGLRF